MNKGLQIANSIMPFITMGITGGETGEIQVRDSIAADINKALSPPTIAITKHNLEILLEVLNERQKTDACISDVIEITLTGTSESQLCGDAVKYEARSIYAECDNHFLGTAN